MLLHREDSYICYSLQFAFQPFDVGHLVNLSIMVGVEYFGFDGLHSLYCLVNGHRVGLIYGQECHIDILHCLHLGRKLRVASDVDAKA